MISESIKIEKVAIAIKNLSPQLSGTTIVQISDLHYDRIHLSTTTLQRAIALVNQVNPDLIVITGDFVTDDPTPIEQLATHLQNLKSKYGVYGCLGNHDIIPATAKDKIIEELGKIKLKILWNEVAYPLGDSLALVGLPDISSRQFRPAEVLATVPYHIPRIVLSHNPNTANILKQYRVDLQLSGHTHGGQIVIPHHGAVISLLPKIINFLPQYLRDRYPYPNYIAKIARNWNWSEGWHQVGKNQLYINRGLGSYFPGRFNCPPEITLITLESR